MTLIPSTTFSPFRRVTFHSHTFWRLGHEHHLEGALICCHTLVFSLSGFVLTLSHFFPFFHLKMFSLNHFTLWNPVYPPSSKFISYSTPLDSIHWEKMPPFLVFCYFLNCLIYLDFNHNKYWLYFELSLWINFSLLGRRALCFVHFL